MSVVDEVRTRVVRGRSAVVAGATYTVPSDGFVWTIFVTFNGATVTAPAAALDYSFRVVTMGGAACDVVRAGSDTIAGGTLYALAADTAAEFYVAAGTDWDVLTAGGGTATAATTSFDPTGLTIVSATNVQDAIEELDAAVGGTAAPVDATYLCLTTNATLTNERVATAGQAISITDGGAGAACTFAFTGACGAVNISTTGTLGCGALTCSSVNAGSGAITTTGTGTFGAAKLTGLTTGIVVADADGDLTAVSGTGLVKVASGVASAYTTDGIVYQASSAPAAVTVGTGLAFAGGTLSSTVTAPTARYTATDGNTLLQWKLQETGTPWVSTGSNTLNVTVGSGSVVADQTGLQAGCAYLASTRLTSGNTSVAPTSTACTVSLWVRLRSYTTNGIMLNKAYRNDGTWTSPFTSIFIAQSTGGVWVPAMTIGGTLRQASITATNHLIFVNTWHLLAGTYDGTSIKWYIDGNLAATGAFSGTIDYGTNGPWEIGGAVGVTQPLDGWVEDVRAESVVRSAAYFRAMFQAGLGRY